ncbi:MAG: hypothetical protein JWO87_1291 [Phycisphaerales bacterium]|nr:hypothetical protein [Phycisphaerales bacterium]
MDLPDFLSADDGGFIHAKGHRIGLHHVIRLYNDGASAEMIAAHYPTLSLALVHKIIGFYLENQPATDEYISAQERETERQIGESRPAPSLEELRDRLAKRRQAEAHHAVHPTER